MFKKHSNEKKASENIENTTNENVVTESADAEKTEDTKPQSPKTWYVGLLEFLKKGIKTVKLSEILMCVIISCIMVFALEALGRHSVKTAISFMVKDPWFFLSNFSIILCSVTLCLFFKRRYFVLSLILLVWASLGVANGVVLTFRNTPLAWVDLSIVKTALDIMNSYIKPVQLIAGGVVVVVAISVIILVLKYGPKKKPNFATASIYQAISIVLCVFAMMGSYHVYNNPECFANLPEAYKNYGFAYCFSCSAVNRGVDEPGEYTKEEVEKIVRLIDKADEKAETENADTENTDTKNAGNKEGEPEVLPNIIYVQLESFFDVKYLKDVEYNIDPIPNFTKLKEENSSGYLRIPGLGGGTCNAEFEVLTGMSVGMFGTCEYPYKTITLNHTAGSVAYDLKDYGYKAHAVHNHTGTFYDRHINYTNLGFDTFIPVEFMHNVERNPINWAKDKILTGEIFKCLNSTEGRDFVFGVSVQSHGKYPTEVVDSNQPVYVKSGMEDGEYKIGFEYFVNQLHEMDMFVGELVNAVKRFDEPTVLVFYGDHLPAMNISKEQLVNEDLFQTEYIVCANFDIPVNDEDIYAYQLNSRVTEMLGLEGNYVNKLHRYYKDNKDAPEYTEALQTLMYDELYGKNYAYGGKTPFEKTDIKYGLDPLFISKVSVGRTATTLKGSGFTEKSKVFVNDTLVSGTFVDTETMVLSKTTAKPNDEIYVAQRCSDKHVLAQTQTYVVKEEDMNQ